MVQHVFGLDVHTAAPIPGLPDGAARGRRCDFERIDGAAIEAAWAPAAHDAETLRDSRHPDGRLFMSIHLHPTLGYRVEAPGHGLHLIAPDGSRIAASFPDGPDWVFQKLLFAQTLPLAATLRGVEVLHAAAIAFDGWAVGMVAASGTGKSAVSAELVSRGAEFLTDDALALEADGAALVAHPGPRFANLHAADLDTVPADRRERLGKETGRSDKVHLRSLGIDQPLPLGALYFLFRQGHAPMTVEALPDAGRVLLGSTFVPHVRSSARLLTHLDVCSRIASSVPCVAIRAPERTKAPEVAERIFADQLG
jgi:hypothetical protein